MFKMDPPEVLKVENFVFNPLEIISMTRIWQYFYTCFVVDHSTTKSYKIVNKLIQFPLYKR